MRSDEAQELLNNYYAKKPKADGDRIEEPYIEDGQTGCIL